MHLSFYWNVNDKFILIKTWRSVCIEIALITSAKLEINIIQLNNWMLKLYARGKTKELFI